MAQKTILVGYAILAILKKLWIAYLASQNTESTNMESTNMDGTNMDLKNIDLNKMDQLSGFETNIKILEALANGVNPLTGELLPTNAPYNSPEVIRAMFFALEHFKNPKKRLPKIKKSLEQKRMENLANGLPENAGLPWPQEHRDQLCDQFKGGVKISSLAAIFGRTNASIAAELKKQGLIEEY